MTDTEVMGWRSIETAPKDGTAVHLARYMNEPWGWVIGWGAWASEGGISGWLSHGYNSVPGNLGLAHPTHWMPLPEPPAEHAAPDERHLHTR